MSTIRQSILDFKQTEKEAIKLAEQQLIKEGKNKLDEMVSKLMEDLNSDEENETSDDTDNKEVVTPEVNDDTRNIGGEFSNFLDKELGTEKPIDIEISIDTNPEKEETPISPIIKTDSPIEPIATEPQTTDVSGDEDIEKVMEMFNELMEDDELVVIKDKENTEETSGLDDIMKETQIIEPTDTIYNENEPEMEIKNQEIEKDLDDAKKLSEIDIKDQPESETELNEEDIMKMMESFTEEEMAEITKEALEELWSPNSDTVETDYDGLDKSASGEGLPIEEDINLIGLPEDIKNVVKTMQNMGIDEESINKVIEKYREVPVEQAVEEGMSGSISHGNARHAGDSQTSYTKIENSRLNEGQLKTLSEGFDKVSKIAKKLEDDNKELKSKLGTLNESKLKLEETVSKYESEILKYKEKFYEVVLEATKASSVNKLLLENSTTANEKKRIVETFQNLKTRAEVNSAFNQLNENFKADGSSMLNESRTLEEIGNKTTKVFTTGSAKIVESTIRQLENPDLAKMMKHINYGKKNN